MAIPFIFSIVLQVLLIVHCIKTGRNTIWIWVLVFLSYAGILAYLAVECCRSCLAAARPSAPRAA